MPRPLKVFRAHLGFFDAIVAAPSRAAALRAWGAGQGEFRQDFASETKDKVAVRAALEKPGTALYRVFGSDDAFLEKPKLRLPASEDVPRKKTPRRKR